MTIQQVIDQATIGMIKASHKLVINQDQYVIPVLDKDSSQIANVWLIQFKKVKHGYNKGSHDTTFDIWTFSDIIQAP